MTARDFITVMKDPVTVIIRNCSKCFEKVLKTDQRKHKPVEKPFFFIEYIKVKKLLVITSCVVLDIYEEIVTHKKLCSLVTK